MNGTALRTALKRAHVTQVELARRLDRHRSMISEWLKDDRVPREWVPLVYEALELPMPESETTDGVEDAIIADPTLSSDDKSVLLVLVRNMRRRHG